MAKIVRLTERDLTRLVKRVIKEQPEDIDSEDYGNHGEKTFQIIKNASKKTVDRFLEKLPENVRFIQISDSEYADFSNIDICAFPKLIFVNLKGTENNFDKQDYGCGYEKPFQGMYDFTP
jgi:hypothetical protein